MIVIIDTKIGNFKSIQNMFSKVGVSTCLSNNLIEIKKAKKIILPGVGSFDEGMKTLKKYELIQLLQDKSVCCKTKILGICLGMQMLANSSEEGHVPGLGIIPGIVQKLDPKNGVKIPHMGWNYALPCQKSNLFEGFTEPPRFYFTHSYWFNTTEKEYLLAQTEYGEVITSAVCKENRIFGVQFHPEKSHRFGFQLLKNFLVC